MKFCAFRYVSGITVAHEYDVRLIEAAFANALVLGVIREIEAEDEHEARDIALQRFAGERADWELTSRGAIIVEQLLGKLRTAR